MHHLIYMLKNRFFFLHQRIFELTNQIANEDVLNNKAQINNLSLMVSGAIFQTWHNNPVYVKDLYILQMGPECANYTSCTTPLIKVPQKTGPKASVSYSFGGLKPLKVLEASFPPSHFYVHHKLLYKPKLMFLKWLKRKKKTDVWISLSVKQRCKLFSM